MYVYQYFFKKLKNRTFKKKSLLTQYQIPYDERS